MHEVATGVLCLSICSEVVCDTPICVAAHVFELKWTSDFSSWPGNKYYWYINQPVRVEVAFRELQLSWDRGQVRSQLALFCTIKCPQHCSPVKQSPSQSNLCRLAIITIFIIASLHLLVQKHSIFRMATAAMTIRLQDLCLRIVLETPKMLQYSHEHSYIWTIWIIYINL
jgi:hypothetical protein